MLFLDLRHNPLSAWHAPDAAPRESLLPPALRMLFLSTDVAHNETNVWIIVPWQERLPVWTAIRYCPAHEKVLKIRKVTVDPIKGWFEFHAYCPVTTCNYSELVPPAAARIPHDSPPHAGRKGKSPVTPLVVQAPCPPHSLVYVEMGHRVVERCNLCGKLREEIEKE
jgi:hypothetical protein